MNMTRVKRPLAKVPTQGFGKFIFGKEVNVILK